MLAAVAGVGHSLSRGLLAAIDDRPGCHSPASALTANYGMTALAQSITESVARRPWEGFRTNQAERVAHRGALLAGNVTAVAAGLGLQRLSGAAPGRADAPRHGANAQLAPHGLRRAVR